MVALLIAPLSATPIENQGCIPFHPTTDQDGEETSDHATIRVPYFTIYNMSMWLVVSLELCFLGLCAVLIRRPNRSNDL